MKSGRNWGRLGMTFNIKQVQLKDLLLEPIRNGLTKPRAIRGRGVPMIAMGEIFANNRIFSFPMERVPVTDKELSSSSIYEGDLLFARQSLVLEGAGKCCIVKEVNEPTVFESHLIRVRLDNSKVLPDYIYYYFNSYQGKENIKTIVEQVAAAGIRGRDLVNLYIPIPPITVQQQILQVLMSIDDKIAINTTINENLESQAQAIFKAWFVDFEPFGGVMPEDMREVPLNELCEIVTKGTTPTTIGKHFSDKGINFLKAESILQNHSFDRNKFAHIDNDTHKVLKRSIIKEGDIVFTIAGTLGRFALVDNTIIPANTNQAVAIIRANKNVISSEYLYSFFIGNWHNEYYAKRVQQAVQANLSLATIKSLPIFVLSNKDMMRYNDLVTPICKAMKANEYENLCLSALRDTLLPKLMNGEIDVSKVKI